VDRFVFRSTCIAALIGSAFGSARSQHPGHLRGVVRDSSGKAVAEAQVSIMSLALMTRTDSAGRFVLRDLPRGDIELSIRHLGFGIQRVTATITRVAYDTITVILAQQLVELSAVDITARRHPFMVDFEQRRARGVGTFVTRDQIDARNTSSPSDLFRTMPQVRLVRVSSGFGVRFPSSATMTGLSGRRGAPQVCSPMLWVDGQKAPAMEIDELRSSDIEAIEVYRGASTLPAQFATAGGAQCGAVVVWTRRAKF
jgi:hypothetical protein